MKARSAGRGVEFDNLIVQEPYLPPFPPLHLSGIDQISSPENVSLTYWFLMSAAERGVEKQVSLEGISSAEEVEKKIASLIV